MGDTPSLINSTHLPLLFRYFSLSLHCCSLLSLHQIHLTREKASNEQTQHSFYVWTFILSSLDEDALYIMNLDTRDTRHTLLEEPKVLSSVLTNIQILYTLFVTSYTLVT